MGGVITAGDSSSSIECLGIAEYSSWQTLIEGSQLVERNLAVVAAVSATKLMVFGGTSEVDDNSGYILTLRPSNCIKSLVSRMTEDLHAKTRLSGLASKSIWLWVMIKEANCT